MERRLEVCVNDTPTGTPPKCLLSPPVNSRREDIESRMEAASERRRRHYSEKKERCREHLQRAKDVSRAAREGFDAMIDMRRTELDRQMTAANGRRTEVIETQRREAEEHFVHVQRTRQAKQEMELDRRSSLLDSAYRREQKLEMQKRSAKQFSPRRRLFHEHPTQTPIKFSPQPSPLKPIDTERKLRSGAPRRLFTDDELPSSSTSVSAVHDEDDDILASFAESTLSDLDKARVCLARTFMHRCKIVHTTESFDVMTKQMRTKAVIVNAKHALQILRCIPQNGSEIATGDARVLLSAYMIANFPKYVLEGQDDPFDVEVLHMARWMIASITLSPSAENIRLVWKLWSGSFASWKHRDAERILHAMIQDAVATESLRDSVSAKDMVEEEKVIWYEQLDGKILKITEAVRRIGGEVAVKRLHAAIAGAKMSLNEFLIHEIMLDVDGLLRDGYKHTTPANIDTSSVEQILADELRSSPQILTTFNHIVREISNLLTAISSERKLFAPLTGTKTSPSWKQKQELFTVVLTLPIHGLVRVSRSETYTAVEFEEINDELSTNTLRILLHTAVDLIKGLHEPAEDHNLESWRREADDRIELEPATVILELYKNVHGLRQRVAKATIRSLAPTVQINGVYWENTRFTEKLTNGEIDAALPNTTAWLLRTIDSLSSVDIQGLQRGKHSTCQDLLHHALSALIDSPIAFGTDPVPEVLRLDVKRILDLQSDLQRAALLGALYHLASGLLTEKIGSTRWVSEFDLSSVSELLRTLDSDRVGQVEEEYVECIRKTMVRCGGETTLLLSEREERMARGWVRSSARSEDAVFSVLRRRVGDRFREAMRTRGGGGELRLMEMEGIGLRRMGGGAELGMEIIHRSNVLSRHTWAVHGGRIRAVLTKAEYTSEAQAPPPTPTENDEDEI